MSAPSLTETLASDVLRIPLAFVNAYAVGRPGGPWVLVDTGIPGGAGYLRGKCATRFGRAPEAIVLTHGHFDHAGNAAALAAEWDVPIYAHPDELPFLTGRSDYPPADPTPGGAIAQLSRAFPTEGFDFGERVRTLPPDGSVPGMPGWRWLHTPGHTPGHVSLWRETDGTLLAGDALATMNLDSWSAMVTHERELARAAVPFTPDWDAAEESVRVLADLRPMRIGAGHGRAMSGPRVHEQLRALSLESQRPEWGRYASTPAVFDREQGVVAVPPEVPDLAGRRAMAVVGGVGLALVLGAIAVGTTLRQRSLA